MTSTSLLPTMARDFGLPLFDLNAFNEELLALNVVSEKLICQHQVLPLFKRGQQLFMAIADPTQQSALDEIKFHTGLAIQCVIVEEDKLRQFIERLITKQTNIILNDSNTEDAPIVNYVHNILLDAVKKGASDLHFEPYDQYYRIRARVDGVLYEVASPPHNLVNRLTTRLKIMAQLDISERRLPQDGRFRLTLSHEQTRDFRVSSCPTIHGEKIVVRILDPNSASLNIEALGFEAWQQEIFCQAIKKPQGMILVTGPTGSGKTITLYAALNALNTEAVNISTVEDPVEIYLAGINQVNINPKANLTFATTLRSFLRQDPDIIMVGEIRDLETAEISIKAAQTGHLLLSTLHTNSAAETLVRLANMGVPAYNIATSATLIMAQRLVRRLCDSCKVPLTIPLEELAGVTIYGPVGCDQCTHGYKGRLGIFELLPITETIGQIIMQGGSVFDIAAQAKKEGMQTLREAGLSKVKAGLTSFMEINYD